MVNVKFTNLALWILASCATVGFATQAESTQQCVQSCVDLAPKNTVCTKSVWAQTNACLAECQQVGGTNLKDILDIVNTVCNTGEHEDMVPFSANDQPVQPEHQPDFSGFHTGPLKVVPIQQQRRALFSPTSPIFATTSTVSATSSSSTQTSNPTPTSTSSVSTTSSSSGSSTSRSSSRTSTQPGSTSSTKTSTSETSNTDTTTTTKTRISTSSTPTTVQSSVVTTSTSTIPTLSALSPIIPTGSSTRVISSGSIAQVPTVAPAGSATAIRVQGAFWIGIVVVAGLMF